MYAVNLYHVDQVFGGKEEGGWWYTYGEPVLHPLNRVFDTFKKADRYHTKCLLIETQLNQGLPSIHSVLSQGQYRFYIGEENELPSPFPKTIPHYE